MNKELSAAIILALFLLFIFIISLAPIADAQRGRQIEAFDEGVNAGQNVTFGQCVSGAASIKNTCFATAMTKYNSCLATAKALTEGKKAAGKTCLNDYKNEKSLCKTAFKSAKKECRKIKHGFFEGLRYAFV